MAETVAELCREYVANNIGGIDALNDDAVERLYQRFSLWLEDQGWDAADADYAINVRQIIREEIQRHRDA